MKLICVTIWLVQNYNSILKHMSWELILWCTHIIFSINLHCLAFNQTIPISLYKSISQTMTVYVGVLCKPTLFDCLHINIPVPYVMSLFANYLCKMQFCLFVKIHLEKQLLIANCYIDMTHKASRLPNYYWDN